MLFFSSEVETGPLQQLVRLAASLQSEHVQLLYQGTIWHQHPLGNPKNTGKNIYSFLKRGFQQQLLFVFESIGAFLTSIVEKQRQCLSNCYFFARGSIDKVFREFFF